MSLPTVTASPAAGHGTSAAPAAPLADPRPTDPPGWAPEQLVVQRSSRTPGLLPAIFDALRGRRELAPGQPLTKLQVDMSAPFLAERFKVAEPAVREALEGVNLYVGGPAADQPRTAVSVDQSIYVPTEGDLRDITSWKYRRWLLHEQGHVVQELLVKPGIAKVLGSRFRGAALNYAAGMFVGPGPSPGGIPAGIARFVKERIDPPKGRNPIRLKDAIHDEHPLEMEAERHAAAFAREHASVPTGTPATAS